MAAAAARLLRRFREVPLSLRPFSGAAPASSQVAAAAAATAAASLPGASHAVLVSQHTALSLLRNYTTRASDDHGDQGSSETGSFRSLLERVNELKKDQNTNVLQKAINEQMKMKEEMDFFDKEIRHEMRELAKSVDTLKKVGNITCVVILGVPLLLVLGHHVLA